MTRLVIIIYFQSLLSILLQLGLTGSGHSRKHWTLAGITLCRPQEQRTLCRAGILCTITRLCGAITRMLRSSRFGRELITTRPLGTETDTFTSITPDWKRSVLRFSVALLFSHLAVTGTVLVASITD